MSLAEELLADLDAAPEEDDRPANSILDSQDGSFSTPIDVRSVRYIARLRDSQKVELFRNFIRDLFTILFFM